MTEHLTFGSLTIAFDERVLRPRTWTVAQSAWAAEILSTGPDGPVLELCSGAGQIGLLAVAGTRRQLVCVDSSETACDFARANALTADMAHQVEVRHAPLETAVRVDESFPLVIADPPWVPCAETERFPNDPLTAIDGGVDGLDVARACLDVIRDHLAPGGSALIQLGTAEQAGLLAGEETLSSNEFTVADVRQHARGVLVRINRRPTVAS